MIITIISYNVIFDNKTIEIFISANNLRIYYIIFPIRAIFKFNR